MSKKIVIASRSYLILCTTFFLFINNIGSVKSKEVSSAPLELKSGMTEENKNICLGGKDPLNLSHIEYLTHFNEGPCSPTVAIPGLNSSKLVVEMNCEEFRQHNPEHFEKCGWKSCEPNHEHAPQKEFSLWPPAKFFFTSNPPSQENLECFLAFYKMI